MIPKSFKLMGMTIRVKLCKMPEEESGEWIPQQQLIRIDESLSPEGRLQTFWHEAMHACCDVMSYDKYGKDEAFVDRLGHCLAQIQQTRK